MQFYLMAQAVRGRPFSTEPYVQFQARTCGIWRSWDRASRYISIVKPIRCTIFEFIEYHYTCFGRSFRPSSGVLDCTHSISYMSYSLADCLLAGTWWKWVPSRAR